MSQPWVRVREKNHTQKNKILQAQIYDEMFLFALEVSRKKFVTLIDFVVTKKNFSGDYYFQVLPTANSQIFPWHHKTMIGSFSISKKFFHFEEVKKF